MGILVLLLTSILVLFLPIGQLFRLTILSSIAINPLDIVVSIFALLSIIKAVREKVFPRALLLIGIFGVIGFVGLLFQLHTLLLSELSISFLYLVRFLSYCAIALGVTICKKNEKEFIWKVMFIPGAIIVIAGYIQYFFYQSLWGVLYAGWDPHLFRMFSTFLDPNFLGPFLVLYFLLLLHLWWEQRIGTYKWILSIFGVLTFMGIVLSFSRGAYVDLAVGALLYLFMRGHKKIAVTIPLLVIVISLLVAFFLPYGEEKHILRTASTKARLVSAQNALVIFEKNPIIGVGFNAYRYAQHRYHLLNGFNWEDTHSGAGVNNSFVFVLATTGILGGIVYGWFWKVIVKKSLNALKAKKPYALLLFVSWVVLLVSGIFENTLFYPSMMVWMFTLLGLTD